MAKEPAHFDRWRTKREQDREQRSIRRQSRHFGDGRAEEHQDHRHEPQKDLGRREVRLDRAGDVLEQAVGGAGAGRGAFSCPVVVEVVAQFLLARCGRFEPVLLVLGEPVLEFEPQDCSAWLREAENQNHPDDPYGVFWSHGLISTSVPFRIPFLCPFFSRGEGTF